VTIRPIFIFSITRGGSTLVQRVLAAHEGVATVSEPWLLLPYLYTLREDGVVAEYTHWLTVRAFEDFCQKLPGGVDDYRQELRVFVLRLYEHAGGDGARFFIDKSPPYYFIADDIMRLFPDGKFIFLWRNPLSIVASIIDTWHGGKLHVTANLEDLFVGLPRLVATYAGSSSVAHAVRFEDLVDGQRESWERLTSYLGIEFDPAALERFTMSRWTDGWVIAPGARGIQSSVQTRLPNGARPSAIPSAESGAADTCGSSAPIGCASWATTNSG